MMRTLFKNFAASRRGGILIETAVIMPILVFMLLGGFEAGRYFLIGQKIQRTAMTVADLASRTESLTADDLDDLFAAAQEVAKPFSFMADGNVMVSSVFRPTGEAPVVDWQEIRGAGGHQSTLGGQGETAGLDQPGMVAEGQAVIVAEVAYDYEPFMFDMFEAQSIRAQATFRPRFSKTVAME